MKGTAPEKPEVKAVEKLSEKKNVRMIKGSVIQNVSESEIEHFKRLGFTEI